MKTSSKTIVSNKKTMNKLISEIYLNLTVHKYIFIIIIF